MSGHLPYSTVGAASIPLKQINNNNFTRTVMGIPLKPETMTQGSEFSRARAKFIHTPVRHYRYKNSAYSKNKAAPVSSSQLIESRRMKAIGRSSTNHQKTAMSWSSQDNTFRNSALARVRGGGSVAPKKKGALENTFMSGGKCC
tara:strand:- start:27 stop:458 length:432 start_codon:yes stop_codon:yes gene_type:complete